MKHENPFKLDNKLILITGGGTGLGYGIAEACTRAGGRVLVTGRREEVLKEACEKLGDKSGYIVNDIAELSSIPAMVKDIEERHGAIDVLINNAGINMKKDSLEVSDEEFQRILQTNVNGLFTITREVAKFMVKRKNGVIIMITSMAALYGIPYVSAYSASKTAVLGMTRALATDFSPHGVRVNAIAPGFIETPMSRKALEADPARKNKVLGRTPMGTLGTPEDIGNVAVFLASDAAKFIIGVNLPVDGGNSIGF